MIITEYIIFKNSYSNSNRYKSVKIISTVFQEDGMSKNKMNAIICQALRQLKTEKTGSEKAWFMSLVTLAKLRSDLFTADKIVEVCLY